MRSVSRFFVIAITLMKLPFAIIGRLLLILLTTVIIITRWKLSNQRLLPFLKNSTIPVFVAILYHIASPAFFPLPYLFEVLLVKGSGYKDQPAYQKWFIQCFLQCGVDYERIVQILGELTDSVAEAKWVVGVCGIRVE